MKKKIISSILSLAMLLSLLPVAAFAVEPSTTNDEATSALELTGYGFLWNGDTTNTGTVYTKGDKLPGGATVSRDDWMGQTLYMALKNTSGKDQNLWFRATVTASDNAQKSSDPEVWGCLGSLKAGDSVTTQAVSFLNRVGQWELCPRTSDANGLNVGDEVKVEIFASENEFSISTETDFATFDNAFTNPAATFNFTVPAKYSGAGTDDGSSDLKVAAKPEVVGGFGWNYDDAQTDFNDARAVYNKTPVTDCLDQTVWVLCAGLDAEKTYTLTVKNGTDELFKVDDVQADEENPTPGFSWSYLHTNDNDPKGPQNSEDVLAKAGTITFTLTENGNTSATAITGEYTVAARDKVTLTGDVTVAATEGSAPTVKVSKTDATKLMGRYYVEVYQNGEVIGHAVTEATAAETPTCAQLNKPIAFTLDANKTITAGSDYGVKIYAAMTTNEKQTDVLFEAGETEAVEKVTVTFNANGGTGDAVTQKIAKGEALTEEQINAAKTAFTKEGYVLKGWAKTADGNAIDLTTETFSTDTTLYAIWESDSIADNSAKFAEVAGLTVTVDTKGAQSTLTISGIIPTIVVNDADTYALTYRLASQAEGDADKTIDVKFTKTDDGITAAFAGGSGVSDGKLVVGENTYSLSVGDLLEATIQPAAPEVSGLDDVVGSAEDIAAIKGHFENEANAPTAANDAGLVAAAAEMVSDSNGSADVKALIAALDNEQEERALEVYLNIKPVSFISEDGETVSRSLKLEITPMVRVVTVTQDSTTPVEGVEAVPVADFDGTKSEPVTITVPVPANFLVTDDLDAVFVKHFKGNETEPSETIKATATTSAVTFTANSFSKYEIVVDKDALTVSFKDEEGNADGDPVPLNIASINTIIKEPLTKANSTFNGWYKEGDAAQTILLPSDGKLTQSVWAALLNAATSNNGSKTLTLIPKFTAGGNPSSPGGSGGGVSSNVTIDRPTNGKVTVTPTAPSKGATVTIKLTPDTGYAVGTVTVTDKDGKAVELTKVNDTQYTFTMPDGKVTVKATFTKVDAPATGFTDVPADAYYADAVKWAVDKGITNGLTATTFGPNNSCTRGQMVTFLWRAAGSPAATGTNSFSDVASGEYYYNAVLWAVEKGITNGTSATTFSPNATVNRGQTVTFLYRYAESPAATGDTSFTDVTADAFYADAVKWAVAEGITNGTSATTFAPSSNCTRGQIVTFMYRQMAE